MIKQWATDHAVDVAFLAQIEQETWHRAMSGAQLPLLSVQDASQRNQLLLRALCCAYFDQLARPKSLTEMTQGFVLIAPCEHPRNEIVAVLDEHSALHHHAGSPAVEVAVFCKALWRDARTAIFWVSMVSARMIESAPLPFASALDSIVCLQKLGVSS